MYESQFTINFAHYYYLYNFTKSNDSLADEFFNNILC